MRSKLIQTAVLLMAFLALFLPAIRHHRQEEAGPLVRMIDPKVDSISGPMGIDHDDIVFSWAYEACDPKQTGDMGWTQKAYQILVYEAGSSGKADERELVWDSGICEGNESFGIVYEGPELSDFTTYEWEAYAYGSDDTGYTCDIQSFTTGFVRTQPFADAQMITMAEDENVYFEGMPVYVKDFSTKEGNGKKLSAAYFVSSALGQYEAYLNGEKIGDDMFAPGWTDYHDRLLYRVTDVTDQLASREEGEDHIAVLLGTGWWAGRNAFETYGYHRPALIAELILVYEDGSQQVIATDESWQYIKDTAVRDADYFNGETFDMRKPDAATLSEASFEGRQVSVSSDFDGVFSAYSGPGVRHVEAYDQIPVSLTVLETGEEKDNVLPMRLAAGQTLIADLGQNMTGVPEITVSGPKDSEITLQFAEMLNDSGSSERGNDGPAGSLYRASYRSAATTINLILDETPDESITYSPSLFYTGFRYLSLTATEDITVWGIKGLFVGNSSPESGSIVTDNEDINRLYENIKWSQRNNFFLVATDCPQRDERLGWMGDLGSFAGTSMYNTDLKAFYDKWADDLMDAQTKEGAYPDTVPATIHTGSGNGGWADAGILIPWEVYRRYGDISYLDKLYPSMKSYMDYLAAVSDLESKSGHIGPGNIYGDWLGAQDTDPDFLCAMWYGADAATMEKIADRLGLKEDADGYGRLHDRIREWIREHYIVGRNSFSQTEMLFLLMYDLEEDREGLEKALADNVEECGCKVMTGFAGTPRLLPMLTRGGRSDLAYKVLFGRENPSWLYSVDQGATTIWERYDSYTKENGFADAAMNSFDHFNEGSVAQWMYESMAGICVDHAREIPILIEPQPCADEQETLSRVEAAYQSVYGKIIVKREGDTYTITIPPNAKAEVILPGREESEILSGGTYRFAVE